jgi:hypothetical protein
MTAVEPALAVELQYRTGAGNVNVPVGVPDKVQLIRFASLQYS